MLTGAAALPSAPLLAPGVCPVVPLEVQPFVDATALAVERLPDADVAVLVAAGERGVHDRAVVDLSGIGVPEVTAIWPAHTSAVSTVSRITQVPQRRATPLPLGLACLSLHLDGRWPLVPVTVSEDASWEVLVATGAGIVQALAQLDLKAVIVAASDGSAGLSPKAPRARIPGAEEWQGRLVAAMREGATGRLRQLGPEEATRVCALGWAPLAVLHGATARARLGLGLRRHGSPRGVGYVVAHGG